jgi:hypothetical protein
MTLEMGIIGIVKIHAIYVVFGPDIDVFETRMWKIRTTRIVIIYLIYAVLGHNTSKY